MRYNYSNIDRSNLNWFKSDKEKNTLTDINVTGNIRGLINASFHMDYPISAIAGKNGCGKSTLLALAACAFHNESEYIPFNQKKKYYTFGDFFTFTSEETGIPGVSINYKVINMLEKKNDIRKKKPSGKWNDFNTRFKRRVVFLGINRIVPPSESSVHKAYRRLFQNDILEDELVQTITGHMCHIFGQPYKRMSVLSHNTHHLYQLQKDNIRYTGFNMGAGENAVLQLLIELYRIGKGGLLVIDEIELGIHIEAQKALINELKEICKKQHCQIICSTHSQYILEALPPEGRFLIENGQTATYIRSGIPVEYAFGKMAGTTTHELAVYTEDIVGQRIVSVFLPARLRERVDIIPIGSDQAVISQIAARYREHKLSCIAFMDGDKRNDYHEHIRKIKIKLEDNVGEDFDAWVESVVNYLPGECWPERFIVETTNCPEAIQILAQKWDMDAESIGILLGNAHAAHKHDEIYCISERLNLNIETVWSDLVYAVKQITPDNARTVSDLIEGMLS